MWLSCLVTLLALLGHNLDKIGKVTELHTEDDKPLSY